SNLNTFDLVRVFGIQQRRILTSGCAITLKLIVRQSKDNGKTLDIQVFVRVYVTTDDGIHPVE
ncbi:hypothetical protein L914_17796, partial [Phytophthora nicotianae]